MKTEEVGGKGGRWKGLSSIDDERERWRRLNAIDEGERGWRGR